MEKEEEEFVVKFMDVLRFQLKKGWMYDTTVSKPQWELIAQHVIPMKELIISEWTSFVEIRTKYVTGK